MATGKRYYWIKLKESFMTSDAVDFLMSQKDGSNYVILYQMLCLKTINTGGKLARQIGEIIIPYDEEKIARDTKYFSVDTVRVALNLYKALGLIYQDKEGMLVLADHINLVGSETDWAEKQRRKRLSLPGGENVPSNVPTNVPQNVPTDIDTRYEDIRHIDIRHEDIQISDKEDESESDDSDCRTKDVRRITEAWNDLGLGQITKITGDSNRGKMLRARVKEFGIEAVLDAINRIRQSPFLRGDNHKGWVITFDWFVKPNNFIKVMEGNYDAHQSGGPGGPEKNQKTFTPTQFD